MPATSTVGLTCNAVKEKAQFKQQFECCPDCHNLDSHLFTAHRLHFTPWIFVSGENQVDLYICCQVENALKNGSPKPKIKHKEPWAPHHGVQGVTANTIATNADISIVMPQNYTAYVADVQKDLEKTEAIFKKLSNNLSEEDEKTVLAVGHELKKKVIDKKKYCEDPVCKACMLTPNRYWSYKMQCWLPLSEYDYFDQKYGLELSHPWNEGHKCAPAAVKGATFTTGEFILPEYQGHLCQTGLWPTFGAHYCANPFFIAAVENPKFHIIAGVPEGEPITNWVPEPYVQHIATVVYLDGDPPF